MNLDTVTSKNGVVKIGKQVSDKLPQVKDPSINLRDRLNDVLVTEKHALLAYQTGINEIIEPELRQLAINNRNNLQEMHTRVFTELYNLGEYQANIATALEIADATEIFTGYRSQFPFQSL